jgi:thymidylate kinase
MFSQKCAFDLSYSLIKYYASRTTDQRIVVLDRYCIDTFIYSKYFFIKNNSHTQYQDLIEEMHKKSLEVMPEISTHYLLPPFADFDAKKERMDVEARDQVWQLMRDYFIEFSSNFHVLKANNTSERFKEIFNALYTNKVTAPINKLSVLSNS